MVQSSLEVDSPPGVVCGKSGAEQITMARMMEAMYEGRRRGMSVHSLGHQARLRTVEWSEGTLVTTGVLGGVEGLVSGSDQGGEIETDAGGDAETDGDSD